MSCGGDDATEVAMLLTAAKEIQERREKVAEEKPRLQPSSKKRPLAPRAPRTAPPEHIVAAALASAEKRRKARMASAAMASASKCS